MFAPFTALEATREGLDGAPGIFVGAQICTPPNPGLSPARFPRPCSAKPVAHGCSRGHSERRHVLGESPDFVGKKTAVRAGTRLFRHPLYR